MDYLEAISFEEIYKGLKKCQRGVIWKDSVSRYSMNNLKNSYLLRQSLLNGTYTLSPYMRFTLYEPKKREIVATSIKDRQFQRSLCDNIVYPQITKSFIRDNLACQKGRGVDDALNRFNVHLRRYFRKYGNKGWVLKCDIKQYFPSTLHSVAKGSISKNVKDSRVLDSIYIIIDSFGGDRGIGLGSQVSQLIELSVLDRLDHIIKERLGVKHYIRYMDDFILIHPDREVLVKCLSVIHDHLTSLGFTLNRKTQIHPLSQGVLFLKWRFILTDTGKVIRRMNRKSVVRMRRKLRKLKLKLLEQKITIQDVFVSYQSWKAHAKRGNTRELLRSMDRYYVRLFGKETPVP